MFRVGERRLSSRSLVALLQARAAARPDDLAYTFLSDGETEGAHLTYGELELRARAIAAHLRQVAQPGDRCLLLHADGLQFLTAFFGCLYAGLVAVPVPLPEPSRLRRTAARLHAVAADCSPAVALTTSPLLRPVQSALETSGALHGLRWMAGDEIEDAAAADWMPAEAGGELAYLQYTSGSTSTPKGVMISHANVLENSARIRSAWGYTPDSVAVMWVPQFHDDGLVHGLIQPLFTGFRSYLLPPLAVVQRPLRWLRAISRHRATHSGGPNFVYALTARKVRPEECEGLDLTSWQVAYNAAEPIQLETLERFSRAFEGCGFRWSSFFPAYGLAEATLLVTTRDLAGAPALCNLRAGELEEGQRVVIAGPADLRAKAVVGCGRVVADTKLLMVDPVTRTRCAPDEVGEVWIANPCVSSGYWNRPDETLETFGARLAYTGEGPFLRTGDLGFLQPDGELYITGRLKDLIIIHGRNHYPQDIELAAERSHPALRAGCGAAFSVELEGEERLVLIQEVDEGAVREAGEVDEIAACVCRGVAEAHEVQVYALALLPPRSLLKTSSGKVQRRACRAELLAGRLEVVGSWRLGAEACAGSEALRPLSGTAAGPGPVAPPTERRREDGRVGDLLAWLRSYGGERICSRLIDERRSIPPPIVLDFGNRGLLGLQVPEEHGGLGLGCRETLRVLEQLGAIDLTLATFVIGHNCLGLRPIQRFAAPERQRELLPLLATGRELAAFALTEPGAGSNPRAISATAVPDGAGGWRLRGTKIWSGTASWAGVINLFVQLRGAGGAPAGMAAFAVRRGTPGLHPGPEALTLGLRGMAQSAVYLDDVTVGPADLLGAPGAGLSVAQDALALSRLCLAAASVGGMKRCAQLMLRYADRRTIATGRLLENPVARAGLGEVATAASAVEALVELAAGMLDRGEEVPAEVFACCKISGPELLWKAADGLVQLLGGRGYLENNLAPQILRDARVFRIFEGPTETLRPFLGSSVLRGSSDLDRFLRRLGADAVADRLHEAALRVEERCVASAAFRSDRVGALRWAQSLVGELAAWAVLEAAAGHAPSARPQRVAEWARLRFEEEARQALAGAAGEAAILGMDEAASLADVLAEAIGDVEQTLPGEDWQLDPILRRGPGHAEGAPAPQAAVEEPLPWMLPKVGDDPGAEVVRGWLLRWLAEEIGLNPEAIDNGRPFSSLGLDSVTGVRMAGELQDWIGRPLATTLVWDFPTIDALVAHLALDGSAQALSGPLPGRDGDEAELLLRRIEALSEEDALRMLEQRFGGLS